MNQRDLALEFLRRFCAADLDGLRSLLAPDLRFQGPLVDVRTADDYLATLGGGSLTKAAFRLLHVSESDGNVAVFYDYVKADSTVRIAQLFRVANGKVSEILVLFDTKAQAGIS